MLNSNNTRVMEYSENERVSVDKAVEILKNGGLDVTKEQAKLILDFLYKLADISLSENLIKSS